MNTAPLQLVPDRTERFAPDLLVEVTSVCDRAWPGNYSSALRTTNDPRAFLAVRPDLFLATDKLRTALESLGRRDLSIALRGGEPSRHARLLDLVRCATPFARELFVETNARWTVEPRRSVREWLAELATLRTILKISFDRMHALDPRDLEEIVSQLERHGVRWLVAITAPDEMTLTRTRELCRWVPDKRLVVQRERARVHAPLGVIDVSGTRAASR